MKAKNNIVKGESSFKIHIRNGSGTICKKNTLNKEPELDFIDTYKKYPEMCCIKCVTYLKQRNKI